MAAAEPPGRKRAALQCPMCPNGLHRVLRTTGRETAVPQRAKQRGHRRGNHPLIQAHGKNQNMLCPIHSVFRQSGLPQHRQKRLLDHGQSLTHNNSLRHQNKIHRLRQVMLMQPEHLPQQPARPRAHHGIAQLLGGDDSQARRRTRRQRPPIGNETTAGQPPSLLPHPRKIPALLQAHPAPQQPARLRFGGHAVRPLKPGSDACGRRGGGWPGWPGRSWWNCGSKIRAAACGVSSTVDIDVS